MITQVLKKKGGCLGAQCLVFRLLCFVLKAVVCLFVDIRILPWICQCVFDLRIWIFSGYIPLLYTASIWNGIIVFSEFATCIEMVGFEVYLVYSFLFHEKAIDCALGYLDEVDYWIYCFQIELFFVLYSVFLLSIILHLNEARRKFVKFSHLTKFWLYTILSVSYIFKKKQSFITLVVVPRIIV